LNLKGYQSRKTIRQKWTETRHGLIRRAKDGLAIYLIPAYTYELSRIEQPKTERVFIKT
jgi:hypothetical protein